MASIRELATARGELLLIDPRKIEVLEGLNSRDMTSVETIEWVAEIAASIEARGYLSSRPLEVFKDGEHIYVAAGHCRLAAINICLSRDIDIKAVPCLVEPKGKSDIERKLDQIPDNEGKKLSLFEAGQSIKYALANGWSVDQVAKHLGKSRSYVDQALDFQSAAPEIHEAVRKGEIAVTLAAQISRDNSKEDAVETVRAAINKAKANGRKKATAKHVAPAPRKTAKADGCSGKSDGELNIKGGALGVSVTFGDRTPIQLPKSVWIAHAQRILKTIENL